MLPKLQLGPVAVGRRQDRFAEPDQSVRSGLQRSPRAGARRAALRWHGYRSDNRYLVFQCLKHTLSLDNEQWRVLDQAHRKRNLSEYEGVVEVDDNLLEALLRVASVVEERVIGIGSPSSG